MVASTRQFAYATTTVDAFRLHAARRSDTGKVTVQALAVDGQELTPTPRFWRSFFTRFGLTENVFRYFEPNEVFERVASRNGDQSLRYCVETGDDGKNGLLLGVTSLDRPVIPYETLVGLVERNGATAVTYRDGLVTSTHHPRARGRSFAIGGDQFQDCYVLETPIDGFGSPRLFLSLLRLVCSNGAVGYTRAFRSDIPAGKDLDHCIDRALTSFDSAEGYVALRQRFESAQRSFASVRECLGLSRLLDRLDQSDALTAPGLPSAFRKLAGNLVELYGLANLEALSDKRRRVLPARCRVYDLLNFASEVATHHATPTAAWQLQAWLGGQLGDEYDLEGTATDAPDFDALFVPQA